MKTNMKSLSLRSASANKQRGVLLIVTMILLLIISGVAAFTIKGSGSSENVANNTRTQALAMQAAEAALRYAETGVLNQNRQDNGKPPGNPAHSFLIANSPPSPDLADWKSEAKWDGGTSTSTVIDLFKLDGNGITACPTNFSTTASREGSFCVLYKDKRPPECMAQYANNQVVWVTCRGFGPDVVASPNKELPSGAEVFLQSIVRLPYPKPP